MRHVVNKPYIPNNGTLGEQLEELGVTPEELPLFLFKDTVVECSFLRWLWINFSQWFLRVLFYLFLRPRKEQLGQLDPDEVKRVYDREAKWYDWKHHLTTCWNDTRWRKRAARFVSAQSSVGCDLQPKVLDVCSGTGLTAWHIALEAWWVDIVGIDFDWEMLSRAKERKMPDVANVEFMLADATNMVYGNGQSANNQTSYFEENTFDLSTIMCGIGGIKESALAFEQILRTLKPTGRLLYSDMHCPLYGYHDQRPFWKRAFHMPKFDAVVWYKATVPTALGILWGWKDPTLDFYLSPFVTYKDDSGRCWGFKLIEREFRKDPWWLHLPLAPVCEVIVEKEEIVEHEMLRRQKILSLINSIV